MIVGIVSDPHGDRRALHSALELCQSFGCDQLWCLGDIVGDPDPNGTVELAASECDILVAGNHDLVAAGRLPVVHIEAHGGERMHRLRESLTPEVRGLLGDLPERVRAYGVEITHASLHDPLSRVDDGRSAETQLGLADEKVVLVGHSHRPFFYDHDDGTFHKDPVACGDVKLSDHGAVLCPGSVLALSGAPATVLVLDLDRRVARWYEVGV